jgi:Ran GTPase-activating protein (RanGAP) involved in mRNA processing and transport
MPEILRIENTSFQNTSLNHLLSPHAKDKTLHTIEIINCEINEVEIAAIINFILNNKNIKTLSLIKTQLHNKPLSKFRSILSGPHGILHIHLSDNDLTLKELIIMGVLEEKNNSLISCDIFPIQNNNHTFTGPSNDIILNSVTQQIDDQYFLLLAVRLYQYKGPSKIVLDLSNNILTSASVVYILALLKLNLLKAINLNKSKFTESEWSAIGDAVAVSTVEEIDVGYDNLQDKGLALFFKRIRNHPKLSIINMINNSISDVGADEIARIIKENREIQYLNLSYNSIHTSGSASIVNAIKTIAHFKVLILNSNHLGDSGAIYLAQALSAHPSLIVLELYSNNITDEAVVEILTAFSANKVLMALNLAANKLTDASAHVISQFLTNNLTLEKFDISENKLSDTGLYFLKNNPRVFCGYNEADTKPDPRLNTSLPTAPAEANTTAVVSQQMTVPPMQVNRGYVNPATVTPYSPEIASALSTSTTAPRFWKYSLKQISPLETIHPHQKDIYPINASSSSNSKK